MTFFSKLKLARWGEVVAKDYLERKGIQILETNFRTKSGEIDLIGKKAECYIFVEVKSRQSINNGFPEEAVNLKKLAHIQSVVWDYFEMNSIDDADWQIDVISILRNPGSDSYEVEWFENVVE